MIPHVIHYFWFGRGEKSQLEKDCIARFALYAPGAVIKEWNEDNFDVGAHPYTKQAYADRKWAFVSDYARMKVLYDEGGIYLDTDMWLVRDISELFSEGTFLGKEDETYVSAGIIGASPQDSYVSDVLAAYDALTVRTPIPKIVTEVYNTKEYNIRLFEPVFFYPFTADTIKEFNRQNAPSNTYAVHMWNYSWGHPVVKFLKKVGLHRSLIAFTEKLGIKKILKKLLGTE
jgi:mannosyltransferase OCH1-like enzyme